MTVTTKGQGQGAGDPHQMLYDPAAQAAFMLPRLNDAQREFILRVKPILCTQRVARRHFDASWPGVATGVEWPDQFWFGSASAHYPAGRHPLGNKRCSYAFRFNEAGLLLREALVPKADAQKERS